MSNTLILSAPTSSPTTKRLSPSCQQVISEHFKGNSAIVTVRSCLADTALYPIINGHRCNGVALCPSSLPADMASTVGAYIWRTLRPKTAVPGINVRNMQVDKPFIAQIPQTGSGQHIELTATATLSSTDDSGTIECSFSSVQPLGIKIQAYAQCTVRYEDHAAWTAEWSRLTFMVQSQIDSLHERAALDKATIMQRGLAYKVFRSFVDYDDAYRVMSEVVFDGLEATALLDFQTAKQLYYGPYNLDGSCHVSGFVCNELESEKDAYISHGWESMKLSPAFDPLSKGEIRNYVRMQHKPNNILQGDVYVLQGGEIVGCWEAVKFKRIPRRVLDIFLPPPKKV